jgi:glycosyltransferase involved in cell wall biosynthesis
MTIDDLTKVTVSVIVPTSGRREFLRKALQSLERSEKKPNEVIVVTDSSVQGSTELIDSIRAEFTNRFENLKCIQSQGPSGASGTRNTGLTHVSSNYVAFLDDDDEFLPNKLDFQLREMVRTESNFSFSDYFRVQGINQTHIDCTPYSKHKGNLAKEIAFDSCRIATPTVIVKSEFVKALLPLFPEHMKLREDNYAWLRLALTPGFKYTHIKQPLVFVNLAVGSIQRPNKTKADKRTPLVTKEEKEIWILAKGNGLAAPPLHFLRVTAFRIMAMAITAYRKRFPKKA